MKENHRFVGVLVESLNADDNDFSSAWGVWLMFDFFWAGSIETALGELCSVVGLS